MNWNNYTFLLNHEEHFIEFNSNILETNLIQQFSINNENKNLQTSRFFGVKCIN